MWALLLVCMVAIGGVSSERTVCDNNRCLKFIPIKQWLRLDVSPGEEELKLMCPILTDVFDCFHAMFLDCTGRTAQELFSLKKEPVASAAKLIIDMEGIKSDLCTEGNQLRNDYIESAACIRSVALDKDRMERCLDNGQYTYIGYADLQAESDPEERTICYRYQDNDNSKCMTTAYVIACLSAEVKEECGEKARATLADLVKRSTFLRYRLCSAQDLKELKTDFLDYIELNREEKKIYSAAFDLKKKK